MGVSIEQTWDENLIYSILKDPDIWADISDDYSDIAKFQIDPKLDGYYFLAVWSGMTCIGLYILHPFNNVTLEIHANILPAHREKCAKDSAKAVLQWIDEYIPERYQKLIARIPECYPHVYHFTLNNGFNDEGRLVKAYQEDGELYDIHILGLERKALGEL